jgi:hypothetical protein
MDIGILGYSDIDPQSPNIPLPTGRQATSQYRNITLSHDQNLLTFDFAALEFTNPAQNQYRYQLVGVDKDWVVIGLNKKQHPVCQPRSRNLYLQSAGQQQ